MKKILLILMISILFLVVLSSGVKASSKDYISPNIGVLKYVPAGTFHRAPDSWLKRFVGCFLIPSYLDCNHGTLLSRVLRFFNLNNTSTVSAFRMAQHEVTRAQFHAIMGSDPTIARYSSGKPAPVSNVNWYHAIAFCNKLSIAEGLTPAYTVSEVDFSTLSFSDIPTHNDSDWDAVSCDWSANGYRLPTEMEWMWAALGAEDARTKTYAGEGMGGSICDHAWYRANSDCGNGNKAQPVGTKIANELGLYDMSGNVTEWCWDIFIGTRPYGDLINYRGPYGVTGTSATRVLRGGGFNGTASSLAIARRVHASQTLSRVGTGFRVVRP